MDRNQAFLAVPALIVALCIVVAFMYFSDKLLQQVEQDQWAAVRIVYSAQEPSRLASK